MLVLEVISKDRTCPKRKQADGFTRWQQGFTPKEHREMLDRERMQEWQAKQDAKRTSERRFDGLLLVIVAGGFTILGVVLSVLLR